MFNTSNNDQEDSEQHSNEISRLEGLEHEQKLPAKCNLESYRVRHLEQNNPESWLRHFQ